MWCKNHERRVAVIDARKMVGNGDGATATIKPSLNVIKLIIVNDYYVSAAFLQLFSIVIIRNSTIFDSVFFRRCSS
jgi:hypothetical protein